MNGDTVTQTLQNQMDKPPDDSKKFKLLMRGLYAIILIFVVAGTILFIKPELAAHIATLAQITIMAIGGVSALGAGSIAAVDFKNSGSLAQVVQATQTK